MNKLDAMTWVPGRRHHVAGTRLAWIFWYVKNLQYPDPENKTVQKELLKQGRQIFGPTLEDVMDRVQKRLGKNRGWR
jgi:hypothetical protein